ncbi:DUF4936 family protein [Massilia sp. G4R7]|uniref:DUF4936 family protein n=1 Tax=Massilia phyllostachyos TaxID=2898585 RepID=A0ABS8Q4K4_9BURK|nr:DUF4936 family protein [Massilia phyllostachyos]MCD2516681.1 DUF4936 family protein [Massilia phyllostachyos]
MIDLYVYYKVREEDAALLAPRVCAMQERLACMGATCQLKRRPESRDGLQTWMEVYPVALASFAATVEQAAIEAKLAEYIQGPRRAEVFMDLPPCA